MDYSQFTFESTYSGFQQYDGPAGFASIDTPDGYIHDLDFTDQGGLSQPVPSWNQASIERFLTDNQRQPLFIAMPQQQIPSLAPPVASIPPVASHHRHGSLSSSQEPSHCGSALSPRADTDLQTDHIPSTPPDLTMFPTFQSAPLDPFKSSSQLFLSGVGGFPGDSHSCVSMADVNSADDVPNDWKDSPTVLNFDSPQRSYTFGSQASITAPTKLASRHSPADQAYSRTMSPKESTSIEKEVHLPHQPPIVIKVTDAYPTPSVRDSEGSDADIDLDSSRSEEEEDEDDNDDEDEDGEYQPVMHRTSPSARQSGGRPKRNAVSRLENAPKRPKTTAPTISQPARPLPPSTSSGSAPFQCHECSLPFKDESSLQAHIKKQHTRPFTCVFHFAGCNSTFASKNEWKRHVMSQHLVLHYWLCDIDTCRNNKNSLSAPKRKGRGKTTQAPVEHTLSLDPIGPPLPNGAIFNRKDLYTQHIRRMHTPANVGKHGKASKKNAASGTPAADWDEEVKRLQNGALRERCQLPTYMECPAPHCAETFTGTDAWDQRMEHVAQHLERAALGREPAVMFGGPADPSLMEWATKSDVAIVRPVGQGGWLLNNPLQAASGGRGVGRKRDVTTPAFPSISASASAVGGSSRAQSFSCGELSGAASVKSEIFVDDGTDQDAEGEDE